MFSSLDYLFKKKKKKQQKNNKNASSPGDLWRRWIVWKQWEGADLPKEDSRSAVGLQWVDDWSFSGAG